MKKLRITSAYGSKSHKMITFDVPDEVADYFIELFNRQNAGEELASVEGNRSMVVRMSILHAEQKF